MGRCLWGAITSSSGRNGDWRSCVHDLGPSQVMGLSLYGGEGRAAVHGPGIVAIVRRMGATEEDVERRRLQILDTSFKPNCVSTQFC